MTRLILLAVIALLALSCGELDPTERAEAAFDARDYTQAATLFKAALKQADPTEVPRLQARLGLTLSLKRDAAGAQAALEGAIAAGDGPVVALARRYLGRLHADAGRHEAADAAFDAAYDWYLKHGPETELLKLQIQRASLALGREQFEHAWSIYADIHQRAVRIGDESLQANGQQGMGILLSNAGEFDAAVDQLTQAAQRFEALGNPTSAGMCYGSLALIALGEDPPDIKQARVYAKKARSAADATTHADLAVQAILLPAMIALAEGDWQAAVQQADATLAAKRGAPFLTEAAELVALKALVKGGDWAAFQTRAASYGPKQDENRAIFEALKGRVALKTGKLAEARRVLTAAVERFERFRSTLSAEHLSAAFNRERAEAYELLLGLLVDAGETHAALSLINQIKARSFATALRVPGVSLRRVGMPDQRTEQRALLRFAEAPAPDPIDPRVVQRALPPDVTLIEYYILPDRLLIFWIDAERVELEQVEVADAAVQQAVNDTLHGVRRAGRDHRAPSTRLGAWLLDPIAERLNKTGADRVLVFVPHRGLHPVPFEALPWAGEMLVDRFPIVSAANLTAVHRALTQPAQASDAMLTVGDAKQNLPGARFEAQEVAQRFAGQALLGTAARESVVKTAMQDAGLLHFAVHGVRPNDAPAYLELAPDSGDDGRLNADELAAARIKANLVVLSVCDSARGKPDTGDEIVGVIDRAFLKAGARSVVASRWPVHDAASVLFMREFYKRLGAKESVLRAFHGAQLALRRKQARPEHLGPDAGTLDGSRVRGMRAVPRRSMPTDFAHPYYWATFSLRGAWQAQPSKAPSIRQP